ncbi:MAG: hypothetical protein FD156_2 [Nitrospirae bacterium]|nr:MAG: hypothetical protein FD156_2 [Nitrospirota bacterium]
MNKNVVAIICASIGAIAVIGGAVIGKNQPRLKIVVQQPNSSSKESPQPQSVPDKKKGKASLTSKDPHRTVTPQRPEGNDKPLSLYCACKANQTFCFRTEPECQTFSPVYGCSQRYSDVAAFSVFDKSKWKEYDNGWVHESKCIIE